MSIRFLLALSFNRETTEQRQCNITTVDAQEPANLEHTEMIHASMNPPTLNWPYDVPEEMAYIYAPYGSRRVAH